MFKVNSDLREKETLNFIAFARYIASKTEDAVHRAKTYTEDNTSNADGANLFEGYLKPISK